MKNNKDMALKIGFFILVFLLGFVVSKLTSKKVETEYIRTDHFIRDTITKDSLIPYKVVVPIYNTDTIILPGEIPLVDTSKIIAEFIKRNYYKQTLFDVDTLGKFDIEMVVQFNKLQELNYEFNPVQKQIKITQKRIYTPFLTSSINTFGFANFGAGFYYNDLGFSLGYTTGFDKHGVELQVNYKF